MYAVMLDACVMVPYALCDTLLRLAERGFYRPLWSQRILDEMKLAILAVHPEIDEARIDARIAAMCDAFDDAVVVGWEPTCAGLDLPDPDDRHVLAAAIKGGAQSLVTFNLKDFPQDRLTRTDVEVVHPDEFLLDQLDLYPGLALQVLNEQAADLTTLRAIWRECSTASSGVVCPGSLTRSAFSHPGEMAIDAEPYAGCVKRDEFGYLRWARRDQRSRRPTQAGVTCVRRRTAD